MDGGSWWTKVHGIAKSWTRLNNFTGSLAQRAGKWDGGTYRWLWRYWEGSRFQLGDRTLWYCLHRAYVHPLYVSTWIKIFKSLKQRAEETELSEPAGDTGSGRSLVSTGEARTLASAKPSSLLHQPNFQPSWQGLRQGGRASHEGVGARSPAAPGRRSQRSSARLLPAPAPSSPSRTTRGWPHPRPHSPGRSPPCKERPWVQQTCGAQASLINRGACPVAFWEL